MEDNKDLKLIVYYEGWQMQCCGTPFSVGDTVKWEVLKDNIMDSPVDIGNIDYFYEAHDDRGGKTILLEGKVAEIKILYHKYELAKDKMCLIPISGKLIKTQMVDGAEERFEGMQAAGYVVMLTECSII